MTALTENYHQAGLRVYSDDDNWASVHMISAGGNRDFEFIYEDDGKPRNEGADKLGGIPADAPLDVLRADHLRRHGRSPRRTPTTAQTSTPVGRPAPLSAFTAPIKIGPAALSDLAPSVPMARFDWIRFDPDGTGGGGEIVGRLRRHHAGRRLDASSAADQSPIVNGGTLQIPAAPGDIYQTRNDAKNLIVRDAPDGAWEAITKLNFEGTTQYHQAGIMVYGDDDELHEVRPHRPHRRRATRSSSSSTR